MRRGELYMNFGVIRAEGRYSQRGVIVEVDSMWFHPIRCWLKLCTNLPPGVRPLRVYLR